MHKILPFIKQAVIYFFIILFVYAALSKLTDFENFQVQVAQSPLLSAFATFIAYATIIGELIIALLLCVTKTKRVGLYFFLGMMTAFTVYIYLILNYSPFVPCSCGGILEKMGWTEHLWFNIIISLLAAALIIYNNTTKQTILYTLVTIAVSTGLVVLLFISSDHIIKRENPFVRRFLPHHIDNPEYMDLKVNSYYIAGLTNDTIYLGNYTAPLLVTAVPANLQTAVEHRITLNETQRSFRSLSIKIQGNEFFVSDGTEPIIYKGNTTKWTANKFMEGTVYFSLLQPFENNRFLFRTQRATNGELVLGRMSVSDSTIFELLENALQKQIDGVFDTDGQLIYDQKTEQIIYLYSYRNQYLVYETADDTFKLGKTIDTTNVAKIEVVTLADGEKKLAAPPQKVNSIASAYNGLLYVKSELMGKNEPRKMWKQTSIIDVYDYNANEYLYSFYSYDHQHNKVKDFAVSDTYFFGLVGNSLVRYRINK